MVATFQRTLPLFDNEDRDIIQRLLHYAVEDYRYDHPDRKLARDLYHEIREGDGIRLLIGPALEGETLVVDPADIDDDCGRILDRFVQELQTESGEWTAIASELEAWRDGVAAESDLTVAFEYLH